MIALLFALMGGLLALVVNDLLDDTPSSIGPAIESVNVPALVR